jgi:hypothetical protein
MFMVEGREAFLEEERFEVVEKKEQKREGGRG